MENKNDEKDYLYDKTKEILLIILIILLFLLSGILFIITNRLGNIVILKMLLTGATGISHDSTSNEVTSATTNSEETDPTTSSNIIIPERHIEKFAITSEVGIWESEKQINIFSDEQYNYAPIIAPGSTGTYLFTIENYLTHMISYDILFSEQNSQNINMKYRLKLNNEYIIGNNNIWVDMQGMNQKNILIPPFTKVIYTLEWYWAEQTNEIDTSLVGAKYLLSIQVSANEVTDD